MVLIVFSPHPKAVEQSLSWIANEALFFRSAAELASTNLWKSCLACSLRCFSIESLAILAWYLSFASLLFSSRLVSFLFFSLSPWPRPSSQFEDRCSFGAACSGCQFPLQPVLNLLSAKRWPCWNLRGGNIFTTHGVSRSCNETKLILIF